MNTEGRVQLANKVVEPPGHSREPWEILRALSEECGVALPYDSISELAILIEPLDKVLEDLYIWLGTC